MKQSKILYIYLLFLIAFPFERVQAQNLKVELSHDKSKVDRSVRNGTATIFFDSNVDNLSIVSKEMREDEPIKKIGNKLWFTNIDVKSDMAIEGVCYRVFLLKSPSSAEYELKTDEISYNQVLYYTVVLPDQFPTTLSAEYLLTKTAMHGIRISYGKRFGGYVSYKWGEYKKAGTCIDDFGEDTDVSPASFLGYIRNSYTAGLRLGINQKLVPVYLYIGGGYGEYGRQWQNQTEIDKNIYFHSDYLKGFEGELGVSCIICKYLYLSLGADALFAKGKISADYQIGVGLNLNMDNLFKNLFKK